MNITILETRPGAFRLRIEDERDPETGKRHFSYETIHGSREDAEFRRLQLLRGSKPRALSGAGKPGLTLGDYLPDWIEKRTLRGEITPRTGEWLGQIFKRLLERLGWVPLAKLTGPVIQDALDNMIAGGLAKSTSDQIRTRLNSALNDAVLDELLAVNPLAARRARRSKVTPPKKTATLTQADVEKLLRYAELHGPSLLLLLQFAIVTGLRRGELCALQWDDLEFVEDDGVLRCQVHVRHNLVMEHKLPKIVPPKTDAGMRTINVPETVARLLLEAKKTSVSPFVFATQSGHHRMPGALTQHVNRLMDAAGLGGFTLHDLRHAHATYLLRLRQSVRSVAERLGHADPAVTLRTYAHVIPKDDASLADLSAGLLPAEPPTPDDAKPEGTKKGDGQSHED